MSTDTRGQTRQLAVTLEGIGSALFLKNPSTSTPRWRFWSRLYHDKRKVDLAFYYPGLGASNRARYKLEAYFLRKRRVHRDAQGWHASGIPEEARENLRQRRATNRF